MQSHAKEVVSVLTRLIFFTFKSDTKEELYYKSAFWLAGAGLFLQQNAQNIFLICDGFIVVFQIAGSSSWHARYTVLTYLQIMVFYNLFTFMNDQQSVNEVRALVVRLLEDEQLEVKTTIHSQHYNHKICKAETCRHNRHCNMNKHKAVWLYNLRLAFGQYMRVYASRRSHCLSASL